MVWYGMVPYHTIPFFTMAFQLPVHALPTRVKAGSISRLYSVISYQRTNEVLGRGQGRRYRWRDPSLFPTGGFYRRTMASLSFSASAHYRQKKENSNSSNRRQLRNRLTESLLRRDKDAVQAQMGLNAIPMESDIVTEKDMNETQIDFQQWRRRIPVESNNVYSSLDALLNDWTEYLVTENSRQGAATWTTTRMQETKLFSDLCYLVTQQSRAYMLRYRATTDGLVAWTRMAGIMNLGSAEVVLQNARKLFNTQPSLQADLANLYLDARMREIERRRSLYTSMFLVYSRSSHPSAGKTCYHLLKQLLQEEEKYVIGEKIDSSAKANKYKTVRLAWPKTFDWTLRALAKNGHGELFDRVRALMNQNGWTDSPVTYDCHIQLLQRLKEENESGLKLPNTETEKNERSRVLEEKARKTYLHLLAYYDLQSHTTDKTKQPYLMFLPATLGKVLLMHKHRYAKCMEIFVDAIQFIQDHPTCKKLVDDKVIELVLSIMIQRQKEDKSTDHADHLANFLLNQFQQGSNHLKLTAAHFALLIEIQIKGGCFDKARKYLEWVEQNKSSSTKHYNAYLDGLLKYHPGNTDEMEVVFDYMKRSSVPDVRPNLNTYTTLMNGWRLSERSGKIERIEELYQLAKDSFEGNLNNLPPSVHRIVIDVWARSGRPEALERCQEIWNSIEAPDGRVYNAMLRAYAIMGQGEAAGALFHELSTNNSWEPDLVSYTHTITAWCKAGEADRAMNVFREMMKKHDKKNSGMFRTHLNLTTIRYLVDSDPVARLQTGKKIYSAMYDSGLIWRHDLLLAIFEKLEVHEERDAVLEFILDFIRSLNPMDGKASARALTDVTRLAADQYVLLLPAEEPEEVKVRRYRKLSKACSKFVKMQKSGMKEASIRM